MVSYSIAPNKYKISTNHIMVGLEVVSFILRPLPDFILQPQLRDKIWEWPGNKLGYMVVT